MANSIWAHLGSQAGRGIVSGLESIAQKKVMDSQRKTLSQFFPDDVSNLILSLPEKDRWPAIQALAPEYSNEQGGENQLGMEQLAQQQQLGPQGPTPINQLLGQAMAAPQKPGDNQAQLMQAIQRPIDQQQITQQQPQQESVRSKFGKALTGAKGSQKGQSSIDQSQKAWLKGQEKSYENAIETDKLLDEMSSLWETGKVASGIKGKIPLLFQNDETQEFHNKSEQLAGLLLQQYGVPTGMKIQFTRGQKPNITQNRNVQKKLIDSLKERTQRPLKINEIKEKLISENNYAIPAGLNTKVSELLNGSSQESSQDKFKGLPDAASEKGSIYESPDGLRVRSVEQNGTWQWQELQ